MRGDPNTFPESAVSRKRLLAVVLLACVLFTCAVAVGCQAFKDDPIMGDHPWQPSGFGYADKK